MPVPLWSLPGLGPRRMGFPFLVADLTPVVSAVSPNTDRTVGGAAVTIIGAQFRTEADGSPPVVVFGGVPATSVVVVDQQTLTCEVPAAPAAGVVDISVTCGSQTGVLGGAFTYFSGVITAISPAYGPLAGGTRVLIAGYNFITGSTIAFGGTPATDVTFIDAEHFSCLTPNHAVGAADVTITEPSGASFSLRGGFQFTLLTRGNDIRRQPGITIQDTLNNAPNTCKFTVDGESNVPIVGEKIAIIDSLDGNRLLFGGTAQFVEQTYEGQIDQLVYPVQCIDFSWLMNKRRPFGRYVSVSASDIVKDLIARFAPGFTTAHVQSNLAKVTAIFDGSKDLVTCLSDLAAAIGGGHHYVDYVQDVHFFHIAPKGIAFSQMPAPTGYLTIASGGQIPTTFSYEPGYYFFRHTFVYDDGSESSFQSISNVFLSPTGTDILSFSGLPLGPNPGSLICVARRIYVNKLVAGFPGGDAIENVRGFCQVDDNVTVAFTTHFGTEGADTAAVIAIPVNTPIPLKGYTGHPIGPATAPTATANLEYGSFFSGAWMQFKVACLYRDGSVSFPSPASNGAGLRNLVRGTNVKGFNLASIPLGASVGGLDCVARVIYMCAGVAPNPNFAFTGEVVFGQPFPQSVKDPDWSGDHVDATIAVLNDNVTTELVNFSRAYLGTVYEDQLGVLVGRGNKPYGNMSTLSADPVPMWPNPDGPSLEDANPPDDLTNTNPDLLHEDSGSQKFTVTTDLSQVRNRVFVVGSGSLATADAEIGATQIQVNDITSFSPTGGTLQITDFGTGDIQKVHYTGVAGIVGEAFVTLAAPLTVSVTQGSIIVNFFEANDVESQNFLAEIELDVNGNKTDGVHEYTVSDGSLKATFQLYMRAYAELELFAWPIVTIRYATRDPKTRSGQVVHVDMSDPPCQGDFLIQDVLIDQIHDESDELLPRYTAAASSVKFELNDLLLKIIGEQVGGSSVSGAGVAASAVATVAAVSSDLIDQFRVSFAYSFIAAANATSFTTVGGGAPSLIGVSSATVTDARGPWIRQTSGIVAGTSNCGFTNTNIFTCTEHEPIARFYVRTGLKINDIRWWMGFWISLMNVETPAGANARGFGLRFVDGVDASLRLISYDGTTVTLGETFPILEKQQEYDIRIASVDKGASMEVRVQCPSYGILTKTMALPTVLKGVRTLLGNQCNLTTQETVAKTLDIHRIASQFGIL